MKGMKITAMIVKAIERPYRGTKIPSIMVPKIMKKRTAFPQYSNIANTFNFHMLVFSSLSTCNWNLTHQQLFQALLATVI